MYLLSLLWSCPIKHSSSFIFLMSSPSLTHSMVSTLISATGPPAHSETSQPMWISTVITWLCLLVWTSLSYEFPMIPVTCFVGSTAPLIMTMSVVKAWEKSVGFWDTSLHLLGVDLRLPAQKFDLLIVQEVMGLRNGAHDCIARGLTS